MKRTISIVLIFVVTTTKAAGDKSTYVEEKSTYVRENHKNVAENSSYMIETKTYDFVEPMKILTTAYCTGKITCTGDHVRYGICAVKKEWVGKTAIIYKRNEDGSIGELLGIFECLDTGFGADSDGNGIGSIQEGKVVDVYFPTLEECTEWMRKTRGKAYIQLYDAEG